jgi:hypothetical protein
MCCDELTRFTADLFFFLISRNRSTRGVRPDIRATCFRRRQCRAALRPQTGSVLNKKGHYRGIVFGGYGG